MIGRREFLHVGGLALGGLGLPTLLRARAGSQPDTSVILVFCLGGMSHLETYDLKPDGPELMRSIFRPIATAVPGMSVCELLPHHARAAKHFTLIRSLTHKITIHNDGSIAVLTGKEPTVPDPESRAKSEHPDVGMIVSKLRGPHRDGLPPYVSIPYPFHMTRPTYLGAGHQPFTVNAPDYGPQDLRLRGVTARTLDDRRTLLDRLDRTRRTLDAVGEKEEDPFRRQAYQVLTSPAVAAAFDLNRESSRLRERYGRNLWGQGCLLARRLAEAGTSVVSVVMNTPESGPRFTNWDDHPGNAMRPGHFGEYMRVRLPYYDQAVAALVEDIASRGLSEKVMVVVMTEFGRTPRIRTGPPDNAIGRDHWPDAYSGLIAGGGLRMGQVIGATNARGEYPTRSPIAPNDVLATIYRHLGIDPETTLTDSTGRPVPLLYSGQVIRELV
jgi:hypothetical protein